MCNNNSKTFTNFSPDDYKLFVEVFSNYLTYCPNISDRNQVFDLWSRLDMEVFFNASRD